MYCALTKVVHDQCNVQVKGCVLGPRHAGYVQQHNEAPFPSAAFSSAGRQEHKAERDSAQTTALLF